MNTTKLPLKNLNTLRDAVLRLDVDVVEELLPQYQGMDLDVEFYGDEIVAGTFPVEYTCQCWELILEKPEMWREKHRKNITKSIAACNEINRMLKARLGSNYHEIDFHAWNKCYYSASDDETIEDICMASEIDLLSHGFRAIDIQLRVAVERFEYEAVESLLKTGANPNGGVSKWRH